MRAYAVSRLAQTALVVFLSLTAVFAMVRLSGDPVLLFMPMDIQAKDVNEFRQRLGFNDPLPVQYARFVGGATRGDFGESLRYRRDALGLVLERLPATFLLAATSLLLTTCVAVPLGILSAVRRNTLLDHASTVATVLGQATPGFWLGRLTVQALLNRDFPVVLAAVFVVSVTYTLINLAVDLLYGWLDPRVRLR